MLVSKSRGQEDWKRFLGPRLEGQEYIMKSISGMLMAAGLILGPASVANAQFSLSIGNPYSGSGLYIGPGYGYAPGGTTYYGSGYSSYVAPGTTYFSTGTYAPQPYAYAPPVYVAPRVVVPYRTYGYGYRNYGYRRGGFRVPFLGRRW
jgi:hypothetical protein